MAVTTPDWLARRGGTTRQGLTALTCSVLFADLPQYSVVATPAEGKFACQVIQTINGKRLDSPGTFASADEAIQAGLDALRKALGW